MEPDSIWAFTVQCALCSQWRLIETKKEYENIRGNILKVLFLCETAQKSCAAPSDIKQEVGGRVWATDKPNIPAPPPGWQRLLHVRTKQTSQFADVYYYPPLRKNKKEFVKKDRLRSTKEVARFLKEYPRYAKKGILSRFSFTIPEPLPVLHATTTNAVANRRIILSLPSPPAARAEAEAQAQAEAEAGAGTETGAVEGAGTREGAGAGVRASHEAVIDRRPSDSYPRASYLPLYDSNSGKPFKKRFCLN